MSIPKEDPLTTSITFPDLDWTVAHEVFGVPEELLNAWPWGVPEFSGDKNWAGHIVSHLYLSVRHREAFENHLLAGIAKVHGGLTEILVSATADEICEAALKAVRECGREGLTSVVDMHPPCHGVATQVDSRVNIRKKLARHSQSACLPAC